MSSMNAFVERAPALSFSPRPDIARVETLMRTDFTVIPAATPIEAALMLLEDEDWAVVVNDTEDLIGIIGRDALEAAVEMVADDVSVPDFDADLSDAYFVESLYVVSDVMQPYVRVLRPSMTAADALASMRTDAVTFAPVVLEGDTRALGVVTRADLERLGTDTAGRSSWRTEPWGTYRDGAQLMGGYVGDRADLVERVSEIAKAWSITTAVSADAPGAVTFAGVILPVLSELYDQLVEHYSDLQEHQFEEIETRDPAWIVRTDALRQRHGDALATLSGLMAVIRYERRPDRERLRSLQMHMEELEAIERDENDLIYEALYVDVGVV